MPRATSRPPATMAAVYTAVRVCGRPYIPPSVSAGGRIYRRLYLRAAVYTFPCLWLPAAVYTAVRICGRPYIPPSVSADGHLYLPKMFLDPSPPPPHHHHRTTPYNHPTATATSTAAGSHMLIILRIFFKLSRQTPRP